MSRRVPPQPPTVAEILAVWDRIEAADPDLSTEGLFARTCDEFGGRIDEGDVADALAVAAEKEKST